MKDLPDEIILWQEKEEIEHPKVESIEEFVGATTFEEYKKANPDKISDEVVVSVTL